MKKPWLAALLNFFFMGPGYIYNGRRALLGVGWTVAAILLTAVEQGPLFPDGKGLQATSPLAFGLMFVAVFLANTCFAIDGWREAKAINAGGGK
ncbi:MAG: hypothetical protein ACYC8T_12275 [Myxococcaceae bacterium]